MSIKVLVIDDEVERLVRLKRLLEAEQYEHDTFVVEVARNSDEGLAVLDQFQPEVILLDVNLKFSHFSGWVTCLHIRRRPGYEHGKRGVIMFSEVHREMVDIETGYYVGADDYIVTPFEDQQLIRKVKEVLCKLRFRIQGSTVNNSNSYQDIENFSEYDEVDEHLKIYWHRHSILLDGEEVRLKHLEYRLLEYLWNHRNRYCSYQDLMLYAFNNITWSDINNKKISDEQLKEMYMPSMDSLHRQIHELRKKLQYDYIKNQQKVGYMLERKSHVI